MRKMIIQRCVQMIVMLFVVSIFCFAIIYAAPGDAADLYIRVGMSEDQIQGIRERLGTDGNIVEQYKNWLSMTAKGDMGVSLSNFQPVLPQILAKIPSTILLMGSSLLLALFLSIPLGLIAGYKKGTIVDNLICGLTHVGMSIPSFWLGIMLIVLLSVQIKLFPTNGMRTSGVNSIGDILWHLVLPMITLTIGTLASFTQYIRSSTISELEEDYVMTARSKGTGEIGILIHHVLKNSLLPVITLVGMSLSSLVSGSVVIESLFGWPGIGTLALSAVRTRDYPMIMAFTLISCAVLIVGNTMADVLYTVVDPRIKQGMIKKYER